MKDKFYLLKHKGLPVKIFSSEERDIVEAIVKYGFRRFSYTVIDRGIANLLEPNIKDYHQYSEIRKEYK